MGTNHYVRYNICDKCGRYDELHVGKSSMGHKYSFQAHDIEEWNIHIKSLQDWDKFIKERNARFFDEYDKELDWDEWKAHLYPHRVNRDQLLVWSEREDVLCRRTPNRERNPSGSSGEGHTPLALVAQD